MADYSIGIDIGGTKIAFGIVDKTGTVLHHEIYDTPKTSREAVIQLIQKNIQIYEQLAKRNGWKLTGIGIGTAGQVHSQKGIIISGTDNIQDWNQVPLRKYLSQHTNLPIILDNDANTFLIAEHLLGYGKNYDNIVCLTLGTGIGGGVMSGGHIIRGHWGGAAELGHVTINMYGPDCNCGSKGCLETYASGIGIANRMKETLQNSLSNTNQHSLYIKKQADHITSKEVMDMYQEGVIEATQVIEQAIQALTFGIISFIHTFNPSIIIFGGGLIDHHPWLVTSVQENVKNKGMHTLVHSVEIVPSKLGHLAGLIGSAQLFWTKNK